MDANNLKENTSKGLGVVELVILIIGGTAITAYYLIPFLLELKEELVLHWWIYLLELSAIILIPLIIYFKFIKEPKSVYSGKYEPVPWYDNRTPVEMLEEQRKKKGYSSPPEPIKEFDFEGTLSSPAPVKGRDVQIHVDYDRGIYKYYSINKDEREYLHDHDYRVVKFKSMISNKKEKYMIKPRFNESSLHFLVIWDIKQFLKSQDINARLFTTKKPDLVFEINGKTYAIEVETGSVLKRSAEKILEKWRVMKKDYDYGFIVVPKRKMVQKYRKIVPALDTRYLKNKLLRIIKNGKKRRI